MDAFPVPADECQFVRTGRQLHIADELRQVPIGLYRREIGAQRVAYRPPFDLVNMVDQLVQRTVLADPLGRGLVADAGHSGQVVAVITAQRGYVRILGRGDAVLGLYLFGSEPGQLDTPRLGVRTVTASSTSCSESRSPVTTSTSKPSFGLGGQGGDDVVCLVPLDRHHRDTQRAQHVLGQFDLSTELLGDLARCAL